MFLISRTVSKLTLALFCMSGWAFGQQGLTISARPGLVNYFEGEAFLNGNAIALTAKDPIFLGVNDSFGMQRGKAEILLMPGTFLRVGGHSEIRMIDPSLVDARFELLQGEAMLEVVGLNHDSQIDVIDSGASILIEKDGLYRFTAGVAPTATVILGSAEVTLLGRSIKLGKGRQTGLVGVLESVRFDPAVDDDLYAWSSVRSQYEAAANYDAATRLAEVGDYGEIGWYFNDVLDSWAWLPLGSFFSPFGWGFHSPVTVGGAAYVNCTVLRGGHWINPPHKPIHGGGDGEERHWVGIGTDRPVAINPKHPPTLNLVTGSPLTNEIARKPGFVAFAPPAGVSVERTKSAEPVRSAQPLTDYATTARESHGEQRSSVSASPNPNHTETRGGIAAGHGGAIASQASTGATHNSGGGGGSQHASAGATHSGGGGGGGGVAMHSSGGGGVGGGGGGASHSAGSSSSGGGSSHK